MARAAAVLWAVAAALLLGGCGDDGASEGESTPAATAVPESSDYYAAMDELVTRLDEAVAAAIAGEADAVKRLNGVVRDTREELRERKAGAGESPAGNLVLTTAAQARDYARNGEREGLELIRDVPIGEARDLLKNEAAGG
jgi:hypothetical protein